MLTCFVMVYLFIIYLFIHLFINSSIHLFIIQSFIYFLLICCCWKQFLWRFVSLIYLAESRHSQRKSAPHDDVIKWKHFPRYCPSVRGIHRSPVNSPHKGQWLVDLRLNKRLSIRSKRCWHYDVTVIGQNLRAQIFRRIVSPPRLVIIGFLTTSYTAWCWQMYNILKFDFQKTPNAGGHISLWIFQRKKPHCFVMGVNLQLETSFLLTRIN